MALFSKKAPGRARTEYRFTKPCEAALRTTVAASEATINPTNGSLF
ncbi:MAG: hypothetical protein P1U86_22130 [Verrucomicrobiales bacterium]|nr:hypothetical protein [Verrucomicrobiales bacterium]